MEPWETTWKKGENPKVMTEKEIKEEEKDMRFSNSYSDKRENKVIRVTDNRQMGLNESRISRLPDELKELDESPIKRVTLLGWEPDNCSIVVEGPENSPNAGGNFEF